jgi:hypothetical protein
MPFKLYRRFSSSVFSTNSAVQALSLFQLLESLPQLLQGIHPLILS